MATAAQVGGHPTRRGRACSPHGARVLLHAALERGAALGAQVLDHPEGLRAEGRGGVSAGARRRARATGGSSGTWWGLFCPTLNLTMGDLCPSFFSMESATACACSGDDRAISRISSSRYTEGCRVCVCVCVCVCARVCVVLAMEDVVRRQPAWVAEVDTVCRCLELGACRRSAIGRLQPACPPSLLGATTPAQWCTRGACRSGDLVPTAARRALEHAHLVLDRPWACMRSRSSAVAGTSPRAWPFSALLRQIAASARL